MTTKVIINTWRALLRLNNSVCTVAYCAVGQIPAWRACAARMRRWPYMFVRRRDARVSNATWWRVPYLLKSRDHVPTALFVEVVRHSGLL